MPYHEGWALQVPILHNFKDIVHTSEACLYSCLKWPLVQGQLQSLLGLSQSSNFVRGRKARPKADSSLFQKQPVPDSSGGPLA